ncbi:MAG: glutamine--tRNA ligase/YqeY domain fusion protein [Phycisphaerae bacterium]|nr:glutamine--tRNA ligase/YqeY domain fusion protein [Phycisphaerae bacterium]
MSADTAEPSPAAARPPHFLEQIIEADLQAGRWGGRVHTRFPPEPNGYLHIGHAKSICLNFGLARTYGGRFNLRFDDTNPAKEEQEYVDSICRDVKWLGCDYDEGPQAGGLFFASNYFEQMYRWAEELVRKGKAYVCELSAEEVSAKRGTPQTPAISPFRDRPPDESLRLLRAMRAGAHPNGSMTLRARIDLASPNFNLRDPVMYRIVHEHHHNTGGDWCLYPMYDWAHGLEDSIEGITHSICTLEFENHRPLYDWFIDAINEGRGPDSEWGPRIHHPRQIEFARLNLTYTVMSKRFLLRLVREARVKGWDDPRMPTISGFRRRGYTPESIRAFCEDVGVTRQNSVIDVGRLENACREHLNRIAPRYMGVLRPLEVVIDNWPAGTVEQIACVNNPEDPGAGTRDVPFSGKLLIERDDFMESPPKKFFRLAPGAEVRLRYAYWIRCVSVEKDGAGNPVRLRCTYDPATRGGNDPPDGRKVKATIHWVSADHAREVEVRLFDRLFNAEQPGARTGDQFDDLNPSSLEVLRARVEPALAEAVNTARSDEPARVQFERLGYFATDPDSRPGAPIFNRIVTLKDLWVKEQKRG